MTEIKYGYKATDSNMCCRGLQYVLGEWQEVEGELIECENGLHFCTELAHTYQFYDSPHDRRFVCEVEDVLKTDITSGVALKRVARRLRLIKEMLPTEANTSSQVNRRNSGDGNRGYYNSGNFNSGDYNSGNCNTGNCNVGNFNSGLSNAGNYNTGRYSTGDYNTGDFNTGNYNTGHYNSGNYSSGHYNSGDYNVGNYNTGSYNTGNNNSGSYNTGDWNTGKNNIGSYNTGDCNHCDDSTGFFCTKTPYTLSFDEPCEYTTSEYRKKFGNLMDELYQRIKSSEPIDITPFLSIPNLTQEKVNELQRLNLESQSNT